MIKNKLLISFGNKKIDNMWYDLNKILWDEYNKTITINLLFEISFFENINSLLLNKLSNPLLLIDDEELTLKLSDINLNYFKISNLSWNNKQYFLPEYIVQFRYDKIEKLQSDLNRKNYSRDCREKDFNWECFLVNKDKIISIDDFDLIVNVNNSLFPIEFRCSKYFKDNYQLQQDIYEYFSNNKDLEFIFNSYLDDECCRIKEESLSINKCYIDLLISEKYNNIIYGAAENNFCLKFNDNLKEDNYISLEKYIENTLADKNSMKDQNGNLAFEL